MNGWIYLIRNGDLYKIGITKNINIRMRQLKPDEVLAKSYISNYRDFEKYLHTRYKKVRIPQTEYFRLNDYEIRDCKRKIILNNYVNYFLLRIFLRLLIYIFIIFLFFILINYLNSSNLSLSISNSFYCTEKVSFLFMIVSFFRDSGENLDFINESRFRILRVIIYLMLTFLVYLLSQIFQYYIF